MNTKISLPYMWLTILFACAFSFGFLFRQNSTITYVDEIVISNIPYYRDVQQAQMDEDLPTGSLYLISGEDYVRIKKIQL